MDNRDIRRRAKKLNGVIKNLTYDMRLHTTQATSNRAVTAVTNCCANFVESTTPSNGGLIYRFCASRPMRTRWMVGAAPHKSVRCRDKSSSDIHTQTSLDISHKQIHDRKPISISIRCNRIEQWVYLRYTDIRQAQYTDTWTCHIHNESGLTTHTDITPPHSSIS